MSEIMRLLLAALLATAMSRHGYRKRSLNASGAALALVVGFVSCASSLSFGLTLIIFFLSSSRITKVGAKKKRRIEDGHQEGGMRNWVQVLANGGLGTCLAGAFWLSTRRADLPPELPLDFAARPTESWLQAAYLCHYACCNADTWASELGVLSSSLPILVTRPWERVPAGTNGGITTAGTAASLAGGLLMGAVFWGLNVAFQPASLASDAPPQWPLLVLGGGAGVVGSLIDSLLGATLQYSGYCSVKRLVVERAKATTRHISGYDVLDNHQVNFLAAAATSALGAYVACGWF